MDQSMPPCLSCGQTTQRLIAKALCIKCYDAQRYARKRAERGRLERDYTCQDCGIHATTEATSGYLPKRCKPCAETRTAELAMMRHRRRYAAQKDTLVERDRTRRAANKARNLAVGLPAGEKTCPKCDAVKPLDDFPIAWGKPNGRHSYCKTCYREYDRTWIERHPEVRAAYGIRWRTANRLTERLKPYPLDVDAYLALLESQHYACAICFDAPDDPYTLQVDHCHETGAVRGLLCPNCNSALGRLGEDPERIRRAADYVEVARAMTTAPS
jgi:hypothetical protein